MSFSLGNLGRGLGSLSDRIRRSTKGDDAAVVLGGSGGGGGSKAAPGPAPGASPSPALDPASGVLLGARPSEEEVEAALADLAPGYFDPPGAFDALEHELRCLPVDFGSTQLEDVADARTGVLEVRGRWCLWLLPWRTVPRWMLTSAYVGAVRGRRRGVPRRLPPAGRRLQPPQLLAYALPLSPVPLNFNTGGQREAVGARDRELCAVCAGRERGHAGGRLAGAGGCWRRLRRAMRMRMLCSARLH